MVASADENTSLATCWRSHPGVLFGLFFLLGCNTLLPLVHGNHPLGQILDYGSIFALAFWSAGLAWRRSRNEGPEAFALLGLGAALSSLRYVPTLLALPHAAITGPILSILSLLALGTGFLLWPQQVRMPRDRIRTFLDGCALVLSMFALAWVAMGSLAQVGQSPRSRMLVYLLQISVCLSLLALWLLQETRLGRPEQALAKRYVRSALIMLLLHSSLTSLLKVTGMYGLGYLGHTSEAFQQVANIFLALAALSPSAASTAAPVPRNPSPLRALIPSLVVLAVLAVLAIQVFRPHVVAARPLLGLGLGLMAILVLRHGLLILDLERLSQGLEARVEARTRELEVHHREAMNGLRVRMMAGLAAGLVHDLNNLLGIVRLRLTLLRETCTPEQSAEVDILEDASERAITMTRRILLSSRLEAQHPSAVDLSDWIEERRSLLQALLQPSQQLDLEVQTHLRVFVDPQSLDQILQNLVSNARDAMTPKGTLHIVARASTSASTPMVRLDVRDDGPGIPADHLADVFEPFFTTKPSGTGLGLATVRNLILQNHGTIHVESGVGKGTTFTLELPPPHEES